jgi:CheY-like chemotaxis protein
MEANPIRALFVRELRRVLPDLYDPRILQRSPLAKLFGLDQRTDTAAALRRILTEAVEALKPADTVPSGSNAWRVYHILYYRYLDQFTQREVATDLALSTRQLRRQEKIAQEVLAEYLWSHHGLEDRASFLNTSARTDGEESAPGAGTPSREQELEWLERTIPDEPVKAREIVEEVLRIVRPLLQALEVAVECDLPDDLPLLTVPLTAARQALLYIITMAARYAPHGEVAIAAEALSQRKVARINVTAQQDIPPSWNVNNAENLEMARKLIEISGGSLEVVSDIASKAPFTARVLLPTAEQIPVLVVDDNVDTLQLVQRYLSNSRYRFIGTSDPREVPALVEQLEMDIIVLDVMLPTIDGWELLGRLREHPKTRHTPIIVCTILSQEQLALTLGAAEFIRKPVSRETLLSALDRQTDQLLRKSH